MRIKSIWRVVYVPDDAPFLEKMNLFDDLDPYQEYVEVIDGQKVSGRYFSIRYRRLFLGKPKNKRWVYSVVSNWSPYRHLPNGKKQSKGGPLHIILNYEYRTVSNLRVEKRPYWTDDYRHMKGHLDMCEFEGGDLEIIH